MKQMHLKRRRSSSTSREAPTGGLPKERPTIHGECPWTPGADKTRHAPSVAAPASSGGTPGWRIGKDPTPRPPGIPNVPPSESPPEEWGPGPETPPRLHHAIHPQGPDIAVKQGPPRPSAPPPSRASTGPEPPPDWRSAWRPGWKPHKAKAHGGHGMAPGCKPTRSRKPWLTPPAQQGAS